jgi:hypothetical protein
MSMCKYILERTFNIEASTVAKALDDSEEFESRLELIDDRYCKDSYPD